MMAFPRESDILSAFVDLITRRSSCLGWVLHPRTVIPRRERHGKKEEKAREDTGSPGTTNQGMSGATEAGEARTMLPSGLGRRRGPQIPGASRTEREHSSALSSAELLQSAPVAEKPQRSHLQTLVLFGFVCGRQHTFR